MRPRLYIWVQLRPRKEAAEVTRSGLLGAAALTAGFALSATLTCTLTTAARAALAAAHVAHTGTLHPQWGNGSLDAVARRCCRLATEPFWDDPCYIKCLMISLQELQRRLPPAQRQQD